MIEVFAKRLKELRLGKGLTQAELGRLIGLTKAGVSAYETEIRMPPPQILSKLASVFNVSTDYLLGITDHPEIMTDAVVGALAFKDAQEYLDRINKETTDTVYPVPIDREIAPGIVARETPIPPSLTADSPVTDWAAFLDDAISRSGVNLAENDKRQIAEAAAAVVATLAKQRTASVAKKQTSRQDKDSTV